MRNFQRTSNAKLLGLAREEIRNRGLSRPAGWNTAEAEVVDKSREMFLIRGSYWYRYSSRVGQYNIGAGYLIGIDEGQIFALRVPRTLSTIQEALDFITPYEVRAARDAGKEVFRQGDIFFVEKRIKKDDMGAIRGTRHKYQAHANAGDPEWYRWITHPQHKAVVLTPGKHYRAYQSTQVHGRTGD